MQNEIVIDEKVFKNLVEDVLSLLKMKGKNFIKEIYSFPLSTDDSIDLYMDKTSTDFLLYLKLSVVNKHDDLFEVSMQSTKYCWYIPEEKFLNKNRISTILNDYFTFLNDHRDRIRMSDFSKFPKFKLDV